MTSNGEICEAKSEEQRQRWHYLALKEISAILCQLLLSDLPSRFL